jgi:hypothetical protein
VVTRVYSAQQYRPQATFRHLADEVSSHRAAADRDPNKKVVAELYKLLGNSYYGKCLTNKEKQTRICYMGDEEASRAVNDPLFMKMDEISKGKSRFPDLGGSDLNE